MQGLLRTLLHTWANSSTSSSVQARPVSAFRSDSVANIMVGPATDLACCTNPAASSLLGVSHRTQHPHETQRHAIIDSEVAPLEAKTQHATKQRSRTSAEQHTRDMGRNARINIKLDLFSSVHFACQQFVLRHQLIFVVSRFPLPIDGVPIHMGPVTAHCHTQHTAQHRYAQEAPVWGHDALRVQSSVACVLHESAKRGWLRHGTSIHLRS